MRRILYPVFLNTFCAALFALPAFAGESMPPVADLVLQIEEYVAKIDTTLSEIEGTVNYKSDADSVVRDCHGLALVALAVGRHSDNSKYKIAAPAIIQSTLDLARIENYDAAKKGVETLKSALIVEADSLTLPQDGTKVAELRPVMKALPNLSAFVKRQTNTETKLKRAINKPESLESLYAATAAMAAISQGSIANAADTAFPDEVTRWKQECERFRDAAIAANAALHDVADGKIDYAAYRQTHQQMTEACDTCHEVFLPKPVTQPSNPASDQLQ